MVQITRGALLMVLSGCAASGGAAHDAGLEADVTLEILPTFGETACGKCVTSACKSAVTACNAQADCAAYLQCIAACPTASKGSAGETCVAKCAGASSSAGAQAQAGIVQCETVGAGASCVCGQTTDAGSRDAGPNDSATDPGYAVLHQSCSGGLPDAGSTCENCEQTYCCHTETACQGDPQCEGFKTCLGDCFAGVVDDAGAHDAAPPADASDFACDEYCLPIWGNGLSGWAARFTCVDTLCTVACGDEAPDACDSCTFSKCADEYADLNASADGYLLTDCLSACASGDDDCKTACTQRFPSEAAAYDALVECIMGKCPSCVGA